MTRQLAIVWLVFATSGCVYYNGIYNANEAARNGDARLKRGNEGEASTLFQTSAEKAESVLVRYPDSKWRTHALYLAGRGAAFGGKCEQGQQRLTEFLAQPDAKIDDRHRARLAYGVCELRSARVADARTRLDSLVAVPNRETARQARLWAARAALAAGDRDAVPGYLASDDDGAMAWELALASLSAKEFARAESLLVSRARRGDYRDLAMRALRDMWTAGHWEGAESIVRQYDLARIQDAYRATMHFVVGDLNLQHGRDSAARYHLSLSRTLAGRDTVLTRESTVRLAFMRVDSASTLAEVDDILASEDSVVRIRPYGRRLIEQALLVHILAQGEDPTGAALFLAAEVARDSLHARKLARDLFLRVVREIPGAPVAPQALYAAGLLEPDSAVVWRTRIQGEYTNSAVAAWLRGEDPALRADFAMTPGVLLVRWNESLRVWSDSIRRMRMPAKDGRQPMEYRQ